MSRPKKSATTTPPTPPTLELLPTPPTPKIKLKKKPECHTCPLNGQANPQCLECPAAREYFKEYGQRDTVSLDALSHGYDELSAQPEEPFFDEAPPPDIVERRQIKRYMAMLIDFAYLPNSDWWIVKHAIISLSSSRRKPMREISGKLGMSTTEYYRAVERLRVKFPELFPRKE